MAKNYGFLVKLAKDVERAEAAMRAELEKQFPEGTPVSCWIQHGQVNASTGVVIGHKPGSIGYVGVRLNSRKQEVRWVTFDSVRVAALSNCNAGKPSPELVASAVRGLRDLLERATRSESGLSEGYPGIAHDLETMRAALHEIAKGEGLALRSVPSTKAKNG